MKFLKDAIRAGNGNDVAAAFSVCDRQIEATSTQLALLKQIRDGLDDAIAEVNEERLCQA